MSFKDFDRKRFIVDTANSYAKRRISKRDFLKKMGMAGVGFSAFNLGMLGGTRPFSGTGMLGDAAYAGGHDDVTAWLKEVSTPFRGTKIRYTSESTPPTNVLAEIKSEFTDATGIDVDIEVVPLEQVLAKAMQDVQGELGTYDLYYLDQSWVATFAQDCIDPVEYYNEKPDLAMPGFDWDDFSQPLVEGLAKYEGRWGGIPFDIPIMALMYREDILDKHGIAPPDTVEELTAAIKAITAAEKGNGIYGTGLQAKSGHYSLNCDWTQVVWNEGGSIFRSDGTFSGNDEAGVRGLEVYQEWLKNSPPESTNSTWDGQWQMGASGQIALALSWGEFFPGWDADGSEVQGLWQIKRPPTGKYGLRSVADAGFGEIPNWGHQGGSILGLSRYSKNIDAAWIFMQWACSKDIMTRCTLGGGFAPMRLSSFADPRVKERERVGNGTTRHLPVIKEIIDNDMASEPDMPLWAGYSNNEIPVELGKLLTGQAYNGSAKACMDEIARLIDAQTKEAGLI
jgi:multiple sugar transport system substrate-binding protein